MLLKNKTLYLAVCLFVLGQTTVFANEIKQPPQRVSIKERVFAILAESPFSEFYQTDYKSETNTEDTEDYDLNYEFDNGSNVDYTFNNEPEEKEDVYKESEFYRKELEKLLENKKTSNKTSINLAQQELPTASINLGLESDKINTNEIADDSFEKPSQTEVNPKETTYVLPVIIEENSSLDKYAYNELALDDESKVLIYNYGNVDEVTCAPGFVTDIVLQPGETLMRITAGDKSRWSYETQYSGADNGTWHVYIKPIQHGIETNLIMVTDKHNYQLRLNTGVNYDPIVRWDYPGEDYPLVNTITDTKVEVESVDKLNFNYEVRNKRSVSWAPKFVFDDGFRMFLSIPEKELRECNPAIFSEKNNTLQFINYKISRDNFVIEGVYDSLQLKVKGETVIIQRCKQ